MGAGVLVQASDLIDVDPLITRGAKIRSEVERVCYRHPAVLEAAVVGLADEYWTLAVTAFVVLRPGADQPEDGPATSDG